MSFARPVLILGALAVVFRVSAADTVFPARLEIKEAEPGLFEVSFNLPVINDARLRAEPVLPDVFREVGEPRITRTQVEYNEFRLMRCAPESLFGQRVAVQGLIGTQIDVVFTLTTLDGRLFTATLKPARAAYVIPEAPSFLELAQEGLFGGAREIVRRPAIVLLVFTLVALSGRRRAMVWAGLSIVIGGITGQILQLSRWMEVPYQLPVIFSSACVLMLVVAALGDRQTSAERLSPIWLTCGLLGLLFGGAGIGMTAGEYLSRSERMLAFTMYTGGIAAGILLLGMVATEAQAIIRAFAPERRRALAYRAFLAGAGTVAVAMAFHQLSSLLFGGGLFPGAPAEIYLAAAGVGMWWGLSGTRVGWRGGLALLSTVAAGLLLGLSGISLPFGSMSVHASLFFLGLALFQPRFDRTLVVIPVSAIILLVQAWYAASFIAENLSYPIAVTTGTALATGAIAWISRLLSSRGGMEAGPLAYKVPGIVLMAAAVVFRTVDYVEWIRSSVVGDIALGFVPVPLLSLALVALALILWPRRRRLQQMLGLRTRQRMIHWILLVAATFTLSIGAVRARNVFFTPEAPRGEVARRTLEQVLGATYTAFNLTDEDELYRRLSQSVTGELVADIYLDSRRKLTSGVRQGAEVTVRGVEVVSLEEGVGGTNPIQGYTYQCTWAVTARVTHLQHVHYRRNFYTGTILLRRSDDRWKIDRLALQSEERVIIPWSAS